MRKLVILSVGLLCWLSVVCAVYADDLIIQQNDDYSGCVDTTLWKNTDWNLGGYEKMYAYTNYIPLIKFDLSGISDQATFTQARLELYVTTNTLGTLNPSLTAYMMLMSGNFGSSTEHAPQDNTVCYLWRNYHTDPALRIGWKADGSYTSSGPLPDVSYSAADYADATGLDTVKNTWMQFDITDMVTTWCADSALNHGVILYTNDGGVYWFNAADYETDPLLRPRLVLTDYQAPEGLEEFQLIWTAKIGAQYQVLKSTDMHEWTPVSGFMLGTETIMQYTLATTESKIFFKVIEQFN